MDDLDDTIQRMREKEHTADWLAVLVLGIIIAILTVVFGMGLMENIADFGKKLLPGISGREITIIVFLLVGFLGLLSVLVYAVVWLLRSGAKGRQEAIIVALYDRLKALESEKKEEEIPTN